MPRKGIGAGPAPRPSPDDGRAVQELIRYATARRWAGSSIDKRVAVILLDTAIDGAMLSYVEAWRRRDDETDFRPYEDNRSKRITWVCDKIKADKATRDAVHKIKTQRNDYVHRLSGSIPDDELLSQAQETAHNIYEKIFGKPPELSTPPSSPGQDALQLLVEIETLFREIQPLVDLTADYDRALTPEQVYEAFDEFAALNADVQPDAKLRLRELYEFRRKALEIGALAVGSNDAEKLETDLEILRKLAQATELAVPLRARLLQVLSASDDAAKYWDEEAKALGARLSRASLSRKRLPLRSLSSMSTPSFDELHYDIGFLPDLYTGKERHEWCFDIVWDDRPYVWSIEDVEKWWDILDNSPLPDMDFGEFESYFFDSRLGVPEVMRRLTQSGSLEAMAVALDRYVLQEADELNDSAAEIHQKFIELGGESVTGPERIAKYCEARLACAQAFVQSEAESRARKAILQKLDQLLFLDLQKPGNIPERGMADIVRLVREGGEVDPHDLGRKLADCQAIATLQRGGPILATCAVKAARPGRNSAVSKWSGYPLGPDWNEFGYAAVASAEREAGKGRAVCKALLTEWQNSSLYATVRTDNGAMKHILELNHFQEVGAPRKSQRQEGKLLSLWVRERATATE